MSNHNRRGPRIHARTALILSLALAGAAGAQFVHGPDNDLDGPSRRGILGFDPHVGCGKGCAAKALLLAGLNPDGSGGGGDEDNGGFTGREAMSATDVLHQNLDIEIFPTTDTITGTNTITVKSTVNGLTKFTVRLRSNFTITQLKVDNVNATATAVGTYGREITLPRTYDAGETFTVLIGYTGVAVSRGFGSIEFTTLGGQSAVFTLSEPYFAATWWPTKDADFGQAGDNSDKFTMQLAVTAPTAMTTNSNGLLQGVDTLSGNRRRHRWATNYPIAPYLVSFGSATYNSWTKNFVHANGSMPVQFFLHPSSDTTGNRAAWEKCIPMLGVFGTVYGDYPFINEKYGIYEFTFGGGMEHQTMTGQGGTGESLTAHELAHQWWGDNVTCRTWSDIWLNESFATYSEAIWQERKTGTVNTAALHAAMADRRPGSVGSSVYRPDASDIGLIFDTDMVYLKGAWVLHMLRHVVGDETFFDILAAHRATHQGSAATTDDFIAVAESVYGADLNWFFDKWIYGIGAPSYRYAFQNVTVNGKPYMRLYLNQNQTASYGTFAMPVDVRVNTASNGAQTYTVFNDAKPEHFVIPVHGAATTIVLDEFNWILNTSKASTTWVNGPAKVVETLPAPGDEVDVGTAPSAIDVYFSENVTCAAGDFTVTRDAAAFPVAFSYNAGALRARLDAGAPLPGGTYAVTIRDTIRTAAANIQLDGEVVDASDPVSLPSGNGTAGGSATITFEVTGCPSDFNGDGFVNGDDYDAFVAAFEAGDMSADFDGDGFVSGDDFDSYVLAFEDGC